MAGSLNRASIIGNVGKDPESRRTQGGDLVVNMSIATSESWTDKSSGEKREKTEWHRITIWGKLAEIAEKYVRKGSKVMVEGKIQTRKWTDQQNIERYSTEIVLQGFDAKLLLLGGKGDGAPAGGGGGASDDRQGGTAQRSLAEDLNDDIPFIYEWR